MEDFGGKDPIRQEETSLFPQQAWETERCRLLDERAPLLGKWLWVLFWLLIPNGLAAVMTHENVVQAFPALEAPGMVVEAAAQLTRAGILWKLSEVERRYRLAAVCTLGSVLSVLLSLAGVREGEALWWLFAIPLLAAQLVGIYAECSAHAAVLDGVDDVQAKKWRRLWKWELGLLVSLLGCLLLVVAVGLLGALVMLAVAVGLAVTAVLQLVYLYRTAKLFREWMPRDLSKGERGVLLGAVIVTAFVALAWMLPTSRQIDTTLTAVEYRFGDPDYVVEHTVTIRGRDTRNRLGRGTFEGSIAVQGWETAGEDWTFRVTFPLEERAFNIEASSSDDSFSQVRDICSLTVDRDWTAFVALLPEERWGDDGSHSARFDPETGRFLVSGPADREAALLRAAELSRGTVIEELFAP